MSGHPYYYGHPHPHHGPPPPPPPGMHPHHGPPPPPPPPHHHYHYPPAMGPPPPHPPAYYVPVPVMMSPYPAVLSTTEHIHHGEIENVTSPPAEIQDEYTPVNWVRSTATTAITQLSGQAFVGGHEGWDGSQLWIIRAHHDGELVPGKLAAKHHSAYIPFDGKEIRVQNIEVLCTTAAEVRWMASSNGKIPPRAVIGGHTKNGENLYIGRAHHQVSLTPGKVHPSHGCLYISFSGTEVCHKTYDILCHF